MEAKPCAETSWIAALPGNGEHKRGSWKNLWQARTRQLSDQSMWALRTRRNFGGGDAKRCRLANPNDSDRRRAAASGSQMSTLEKTYGADPSLEAFVFVAVGDAHPDDVIRHAMVQHCFVMDAR